MILRIKKRFPFRNLMLWLAMLFVFSFALLEHVSIPIPAFSLVKRPLLYAGGLCILTQVNVLLKNILKKRYFYVVLVLLIMCVTMVIATYLNPKGDAALMRSVQRLVLYLVELFALVILLAEAGWSRRALRFLYGYLLVLTILTDTLMLTGIVRFNSGAHEHYLIGTKFTIVYLHMNLIVFWRMKCMDEKNTVYLSRWLLWGAAAMFAWLSLRVSCMTGLIGACMLIILLFWQNTGRRETVKWLSSPVNMNICLMISFVFPFVVDSIMSLSVFEYFVEELLGRNSNLTGRLNIYQVFADRMAGNWLLGYGYGSGNQMSVKLFGYANTQNVILHWILQTGVLGTTMLIALLTVIMWRVQRYRLDQTMVIRPLLALIYVYIALGTVEPTIDMSFILWFALLFMYVNGSEPVKGKT
ncbi:MAG: O-antigen ligase family protein [Clostridia bacterium]|nr:O-antigen ligase family protein [Clostridia bacterium]